MTKTSAYLLVPFLLTASALNAAIISVQLSDTSVAAGHTLQTQEFEMEDGQIGHKLFGDFSSVPATFLFFPIQEAYVDLVVQKNDSFPGMYLTWEFTLTRQDGLNDGSFFFWVQDVNTLGILAAHSLPIAELVEGMFYVPVLPESNEAEVRLRWWTDADVPFNVSVPSNSIDFFAGAAPLVTPEPGTMGMMVAALGGLAWWTRRRAY